MNWHYFPSKPFGFNSFRFPQSLLQATSCGAAKVVFNPVSAKLFEDFFLLFFAATQALSTSILALLSKADANVQHLLPLFQIFESVFLKVFFKPLLSLEINPFRLSSIRLAFKADAKVEPTFKVYKL